MNISRSIILINLAIAACVWAVWEYRVNSTATLESNAGPDVIVGDITGVARYGPVGGETAFSIGTVSCNVGTAPLAWISNTNQHPVITQNLYRVKNGRIEMLGMAWLKHGFTALQQSLCGTCTPSGSGSWLGVGCSDPYGASLNGSQSGLGPRSQVNASSGVFSWPKGNLPSTGSLDGRLRVLTSDITPSLNTGARYFTESMYVAPDDAAAGNKNNNASYREVFVQSVSGGWTLAFGSPQTVRTQAAIFAWKAVHSDVKIFTVDIPDDGRIFVGVRTTPRQGGGFHTEFAVENLNSHRSVRSVGVRYGSSGISNPGFRDCDYQFEPFSGTDWTPVVSGNDIAWATQTFAQNQNANAIRWNTLYSFWCDSELPPRELTLGMFRPGTVAERTIDLMTPVFPDSFEVREGQHVAGMFTDLFVSDNQYFRLALASRAIVPRIELRLNTTVPTETPTDFAFRLEATMRGDAFGNVLQVVELRNQQTGEFEVVDIRPAETSDTPLAITPSGDVRRFIQAGTRAVESKIEWRVNPTLSRNPYAWYIDIDEAVLLVTN
jgi:hypothetical protein